MAKLSFLCNGLFVCCMVVGVYATSESYFYETDSPHYKSEHYLRLILNNGEIHTFSKRDVSSIKSSIVSSLSTNATEETAIKQKTTKKPLKALQYNRTSESTIDDDLKKHLLGFNGTGQRKDVTVPRTTPQPPLVHHSPVLEMNPNESSELESALSEVDIDETAINKTLGEHNVTTFKTDSHEYYNSTFDTNEETGNKYWVDMTKRNDVKVNELLSKSYRRAATVKLSFDFPFYGHFIKNVMVATGGFLYTGDYVHSWLAATQYIAPLMANFDTSVSNYSFVRYVDNGTAFTVEWDNVSLRENPDEGNFTFQVTLFKNGDIVFVYKNVPVLVKDIKDDNHPVKVGLSDAYVTDRTLYYVRKKTIYEYHRVNFARDDVKNWTVIYLKALPTCLDFHDCNDCLTSLQTFKCVWCPSFNRCSTGVDRFRHQWIINGCVTRNITSNDQCASAKGNANKFLVHDQDMFVHVADESKTSGVFNDAVMRVRQPNEQLLGMSGVLAILFLVGMVFGLSCWVLYAYRNPHTTSGQILIRYRPTQWRFRRGEARYTAATIHM